MSPQRKALVISTGSGLYCPAGDFYIDPCRPVENAVITHAHGDHARAGSAHYLASHDSVPILRHRLGTQASIQGIADGETLAMKNARVSLHPAGHILGASQIRITVAGEVWVVSGDYKRADDPTCRPFEVVPCHTFITESTFALPVYRWEAGREVARDILTWWEQNREQGRTSILFCYALGKAQRLLAELARLTERPVYIHGGLEALTAIYRKAGVNMLETRLVSETDRKHDFTGELVLAPPSAFRSVWMKRFKHFDTGFASGWMRIRGNWRRHGYDRGFVLSDHADWPELLQTVRDTGAHHILATHGYTYALVRYLRELGYESDTIKTHFELEKEDFEPAEVTA